MKIQEPTVPPVAGRQILQATEGVGGWVPPADITPLLPDTSAPAAEAPAVPVRARRPANTANIGAATGHTHPSPAGPPAACSKARRDDGGATEALGEVITPVEVGPIGVDGGARVPTLEPRTGPETAPRAA